VSFSQRFFPDGELSASSMKAAIIAAGTRLRAIQKNYRDIGWSEAIGASGTIRCVAHIVQDKGWANDGIITVDALDKLIAFMIEGKEMEALSLAGLSAERKSVLPGGVAVLKAAFNQLKIDKMTVSDGALREGLLYDLLGRIRHDDERERAVLAMARRYHVDEAQTDRIIVMLDQLFDQVAEVWQLKEKHRHSLYWAARLHEIGLSVSHDQYHKHSYYLLAHSNLPGFSREGQHALAVMVRGQRRSFPKKYIKALPAESQLLTRHLTVLLRLAMVFNRGRSVDGDTPLTLAVTSKELQLTLPKGWLAEHPLTEADLLQEMRYLQDADIEMTLG
jgi:exopolyphosphatase/guanosine-5'-triphosphate,3'-diphosphate pyrophosphatase